MMIYTLDRLLTLICHSAFSYDIFKKNQDVRNSNGNSCGSSSKLAQCNKLLGKVLIAITYPVSDNDLNHFFSPHDSPPIWMS